MSIIIIVLGLSIVFYIAYRSYGTFLAKKVFDLNNENITPSVEMEDGLDYVPTEPKFLLGQHFSAIAAAGPITGPIIAGIAYGWVPTLIWILVGSIFIGGVHDIGALVASIRNKGRSITETVRTQVSRSAWVLFNLFVFVTLVMVIVAFTDITTSSFVNAIDIGNGVMVGGGAIATSSMLYLALPIIMGLLLKFTKLNLTWATIIFLPLVGVAIWVGKYIPFDIQQAMGLATPLEAQKGLEYHHHGLLPDCGDPTGLDAPTATRSPGWIFLVFCGNCGSHWCAFWRIQSQLSSFYKTCQ